jgi:uncharacterized spore protein YtfJ
MANVSKEILDTIMGHVEKLATTKTIMGDPVNIGDKTIIPVMKVMVGFGAGGGEGEVPSKEEKKATAGSGGGGGGGLSISPAAFILIDGEKISIHGPKPRTFEHLFEQVPDVVEKITEIATKKEKKQEKDESKK